MKSAGPTADHHGENGTGSTVGEKQNGKVSFGLSGGHIDEDGQEQISQPQTNDDVKRHRRSWAQGGMPVTDAARYVGRSAAAIGRAMAAGDLNPVAFTEALLDRIAAQASPVFLKVTRDRALAEAQAAASRLALGRPLSPLDGVPIAWKDLIDMRGETTTAASDLYRDREPAISDAAIVANATAAGMVSIGKTNLTEFAYSGLGLNPHFGTPVNPCDSKDQRSPGGSSSGSAVAVASALAPVAIGTDTGGSVRIPASFNGIVGYKSSEGRIDSSGVFPLSKTLDTVGPLALTVEDCILTEMILRGAVSTPVKRHGPEGLRIFVPETVVIDDLEEAVSRNFEASLERLAAAGATIERGPLPEFEETARLAREVGSVLAADAYFEHRSVVDGPDRARIDRRVISRIETAKSMSAVDLVTLHRGRRVAIASLKEKLKGTLLAMPTTPHTAPRIAPLDADDERFHRTNLRTLRNTSIGNFLNLPGVAIPNGKDAKGLPTSFLLAATGGEDDRLLGAALGTESLIREPSYKDLEQREEC